jgi:hypothetical protein
MSCPKTRPGALFRTRIHVRPKEIFLKRPPLICAPASPFLRANMLGAHLPALPPIPPFPVVPLSPFRRLCAFLGRPLMTNLRDSTAALSNDRTNALVLPATMRARLKVGPLATSSFIQLFEKTPIHTAHEPASATPSISCRSSSSSLRQVPRGPVVPGAHAGTRPSASAFHTAPVQHSPRPISR